ncbi:anti-sigma factor [Erythrobacter alti]|uniref:anti-sigma factor n=1 Tax=Erythrobacter alti TaxID=1896145 RepID=UPI0030F3AA36
MDDIDPGDRDLFAGEYALGVLEGDELAAAERLYLSDRDFAENVRWWSYRLGQMAESMGAVEPSASVWPNIEQRLVDRDPVDRQIVERLEQSRAKGISAWALAFGMAGAAAVAAVLTLLLVQPAGQAPIAPVETTAPASGPVLIAQLQSADGALTLAGLVDPNASELSLNIEGFAPGEGQAAELWVVPAGGAPQSLGLIPASGSFERQLTEAEQQALVAGASLAVTYEDASSAPHEAPSTDILVIGGLSSV